MSSLASQKLVLRIIFIHSDEYDCNKAQYHAKNLDFEDLLTIDIVAQNGGPKWSCLENDDKQRKWDHMVKTGSELPFLDHSQTQIDKKSDDISQKCSDQDDFSLPDGH